MDFGCSNWPVWDVCASGGIFAPAVDISAALYVPCVYNFLSRIVITLKSEVKKRVQPWYIK